jgi:hypothetical protein
MCLMSKVGTNNDCTGWSVIGLQVNLMLPWRKMGEPQRGDGVFSNTKSTPIVLSSLLALISLLLCMQHGWAQTPAVGGNGPHIVVGVCPEYV